MGSAQEAAAADAADVGGRAAQILRTVFEEIEEKKIRAVEVFFAVDTDGSGEMDRMEFEEALHMMGFTELSVDDMDLAFHELDADKGGTVRPPPPSHALPRRRSPHGPGELVSWG